MALQQQDCKPQNGMRISGYVITGSDLSHNTANGFLKCSSGYMASRSTRARGSGLQFVKRSWRITMGSYQQPVSRVREQPSTFLSLLLLNIAKQFQGYLM